MTHSRDAWELLAEYLLKEKSVRHLIDLIVRPRDVDISLLSFLSRDFLLMHKQKKLKIVGDYKV